MTNYQAAPDMLAHILERKHEIITREKQHTDLKSIKAIARESAPVRGFTARLFTDTQHGPAIIAEVKKASPSRGVIRHDFDPMAIAKSYQQGGASCLSVLTDEDFFQGSNDYIGLAKHACDLPVLRKDFIIDPWQVYQTRAIGADAILLICAILTHEQLHQLYELACDIGLDCLVEVHNNDEMGRALMLNAPLIGINNRNLRSFDTDLQTSIDLAAKAQTQTETILISESGIHKNEHILMLAKHGIKAFLVGESLMRQENPGAALQTLLGN